MIVDDVGASPSRRGGDGAELLGRGVGDLLCELGRGVADADLDDHGVGWNGR
ncbi:MAG: hypothetical protein WKF58_04360 [Ilumatobacteraceae bacterium]